MKKVIPGDGEFRCRRCGSTMMEFNRGELCEECRKVDEEKGGKP